MQGQTNIQETNNDLFPEIISEYDRLVSEYGRLNEARLVISQGEDLVLIKRDEQSEQHVAIFTEFEYSLWKFRSNNVESWGAHRAKTISIAAAKAYLSSGIKGQNDDYIDDQLEVVTRTAKSPVNLDFLKRIDLANENECFAGLVYILNISYFQNETGEPSQNVDEILQRIQKSFKIEDSRCCLEDTINVPTTVLTGLVPMQNGKQVALSPSKFTTSGETANEALQFLIFITDAKDDDIYEKDKKYGDWRPLPFEDKRMSRLLDCQEELANAMKCANGMTKTEIKERIVPFLGGFEKLDEESLKTYVDIIKTPTFDNIDDPLDEFMKTILEISSMLKTALSDEYDEEETAKKYWEIIAFIRADIFNLMQGSEPNTIQRTEIGNKIICIRTQIAAAYLKENPQTAYKIPRLINTMTSNQNPRTSTWLLETMNTLTMIAYLSKTKSKAEIARTFLEIKEQSFQNTLNQMLLSQCAKAAEILSSSDNVPIEWAITAAQEK